MTKRSLFQRAAAVPFAHLLGSGRSKTSAARAEEEDKKDPDAKAEDEDEKKDPDGKKGEDPKDPPEDDKVATDGDDDDKKDPDGKKSKRRAKADDDEDEKCAEEDDDDDDIAAAARAGRLAERTRCAKIFSSQAAGVRPDVAAQLAFTTELTSAEAIGILEAAAMTGAAPAATSRLHERMSRVRVPDLSQAPDAEKKPTGATAQAAAIAAAVAKARPSKG